MHSLLKTTAGFARRNRDQLLLAAGAIVVIGVQVKSQNSMVSFLEDQGLLEQYQSSL